MDLNQVINEIKRRSESICQILFYIISGFCFIFYVGNFNGGFMPVIGTLISMILEVALWLLIPVLLSIRRRSMAKWAFLGLSIYWTLTTIFQLLQGAGLATAFASSLACATGAFSFIIACAMITMSVFAVIAYWKKDTKMKLIALAIYLGTLLFFLIYFALRVALEAKWGTAWNEYLGLIYSCILIPFAMLFAALSFWFNEEELHFAAFEKKRTSVATPMDEQESDVQEKGASVMENDETVEPVAEESAEEVVSDASERLSDDDAPSDEN